MSKKQKAEVYAVPDETTFANHLVETFMTEEGISIETEENEEPIDVILSVPDLHVNFTKWLCDVIRRSTYEDIGSPKDVMLN